MYRYKSGIEIIDMAMGGFDAGTNYLILAPSMSSADKLAIALSRPVAGEYSIILSTDERASEVIDYCKLTGCDKQFVGVIDAITKTSSPTVTDTQRLKFVASPTDLTGIGIKFSKMSEAIFEGSFSEDDSGLFPPPIRFCVSSVSTLLMYRNLGVMYQFLHVIIAKLKKMEAVGFFLLNNESYDEKTISLIKQLMTGVIEVKTDGGETYFRVIGILGIPSDWVRFRIEKGNVVTKQ
ncbi:MAG: hypothetical protein ABFC24_06230 [Methanoregulaceae archaeon]